MAASPYGRPQHALGELGELGGLTIDATLRRSLSAMPTVELSLRDVPTQPATLGLDLVRVDARSLVRQLERRIADLPARAARIEAERAAAAEEAARAQHGLTQPFKHAGALKAATARASEIAIEMRCKTGRPLRPRPRGGDTTDATMAGAAEVDRIARASFPTPVQGARRGIAATPARMSRTVATAAMAISRGGPARHG